MPVNSSVFSFLISSLLEGEGEGFVTMGELRSDIRTTDISFILKTFFFLMPPNVHTNFRDAPPGCGGSVTDF